MKSALQLLCLLAALVTTSAYAQDWGDEDYPSLNEEAPARQAPAPQEPAAQDRLAVEARPSIELQPLPPRRQRAERWRTHENSQAEYCRYLRESVIPQSRMSRGEAQDLLQNYRCQ